MNDFEELARRAATAARDNTAALDVPPLTPRRRPVAVIGLLLLAGAVAVGAFLATRGDDADDTDVAGDRVDDVIAPEWPYRLTWTEPDPALEFAAVDLPLDIGGLPLDEFGAHTLLFGSDNDADPFGDGDLLVVTFETTAGVESEFSGDPVTVRGKEGYQDTLLAEFGFDTVVSWQETETLAVVVASRSSSVEWLVEVAETLEFDNENIRVAAPDGLTLLVDANQLPFGASAYQRVGSISSLVSESQDVIQILWSEPAQADAILMSRYLAADARPEAIRGTDGWLLSPGLPGQSYGGDTAMWVERGVLFTLSTSPGIDPVTLAAELEEIDEARWAQLVVETKERDEREALGDGEMVAEGTFTIDGQEVIWRVTTGEEGLCGFLRSGSAGSSGCGPISTGVVTFSLSDTPSSDASVTAWGTVMPEVERIVIEGSDNLVAIRTLDSGSRVFGVVVPATEAVGDLVAFAADGSEVWRQRLDAGPPVPDKPTQKVELTSGTSGSVEWRLYTEAEELCLDVTQPSEGASSCSGGPVLWVETSDALVIGGLVPACVTSVVAATRAQDPASADLTVVGDRVAFGIVESPQMSVLTLSDAAGMVLA